MDSHSINTQSIGRKYIVTTLMYYYDPKKDNNPIIINVEIISNKLKYTSIVRVLEDLYLNPSNDACISPGDSLETAFLENAALEKMIGECDHLQDIIDKSDKVSRIFFDRFKPKYSPRIKRLAKKKRTLRTFH